MTTLYVLGAGRHLTAGERPATTVTSVHELTTDWLAERHELTPPTPGPARRAVRLTARRPVAPDRD